MGMKSHFCRYSLYPLRDLTLPENIVNIPGGRQRSSTGVHGRFPLLFSAEKPLIPFAITNEIQFFKFFKLCQNLCHLNSKSQKTQCFQRVSVLRHRTANPRFPSSNLGGASNLNVMENAPIVIIQSLLGRFSFQKCFFFKPQKASKCLK